MPIFFTQSEPNEVSELINHIPPNVNAYIRDIVGGHISQELYGEGFHIYNDWYRQASNYPGIEKALDEYESCCKMCYRIDEDVVLKLINGYGSVGSLIP